MTVRAIVGLFGLNLGLLAVGIAVLYALRPYRSVGEVGRLGGLAYLLGVAATGVVFTFELAVGLPLGLTGMVATLVVLPAVASAVGARRGHRLPVFSVGPIRLPTVHPVAALAGAGLILYLETLFRAGRLNGLFEWDGWSFWVPKALAIHEYRGLDEAWFTTLPGASYPPTVPAFEAAAFHFMGAVDPITLHLLFWGFHAGFLWAVLGLLSPRVRKTILVPCLLALAVLPNIVWRVLNPQGDLLVGQLVVAAALLVLLWLDERRPWHLPAATVLLAGAMLTKREGLLLAACLIAAAATASWSSRRRDWPRLAAVLGAAFLLSLPWRIWFTVNGLPSDAPDGGFLGILDHLDRGWPAFQLSVRTHLSVDLWFFACVLLLVGAVLAAIAGHRRIGAFAATFLGLAILGSMWVVWSIPELPLTQDGAVNPIVRLVGSSALFAAAVLPLLLERAWASSAPVPSLERAKRLAPPLPRTTGALVLVGALLLYPAALLASGPPVFPSTSDCRPAPTSEGTLRAVFGRFSTMQEAIALVARVREVGYTQANAEPDGCGLVRVAVHGVTSIAGGRDLQREAGTVDLHPTLEQDD